MYGSISVMWTNIFTDVWSSCQRHDPYNVDPTPPVWHQLASHRNHVASLRQAAGAVCQGTEWRGPEWSHSGASIIGNRWTQALKWHCCNCLKHLTNKWKEREREKQQKCEKRPTDESQCKRGTIWGLSQGTQWYGASTNSITIACEARNRERATHVLYSLECNRNMRCHASPRNDMIQSLINCPFQCHINS